MNKFLGIDFSGNYLMWRDGNKNSNVKNGEGVLAEAFPAAQLKIWKLPFTRYNGTKQQATSNRRSIIDYL